MRDKRLVAASFSRAAASYDQVAQLQRAIADQLAAWLPAEPVETLIDLGSGTGYSNSVLQPLASEHLVSIDLAEGMLAFSRGNGARGRFVAGDAENLPLADRSVDLLWSSLALQWSEQPDALFAELARVLRPGGRVLLSTLGPDTLTELKQSWAQVDAHQHVNSFMEISRWLEFAAGLELVRHQPETRVQQYRELNQLLRELRALGAHNVNPDRPQGLGGQGSLKQMIRAYEQFRSEDGLLPATYEVHYLEFIRR